MIFGVSWMVLRASRVSRRNCLLLCACVFGLDCGDATEATDTTIDAGSDVSSSTDVVSEDAVHGPEDAAHVVDITTDLASDNRPPIDRDAGAECRALSIDRGSSPPDGVCPSDAGKPPFLRYACLPAPESGTCEESYSEACVLHTYECGLSRRADGIWCGPLTDSVGRCCYVTYGNCLID
jgi:hypothetical protein